MAGIGSRLRAWARTRTAALSFLLALLVVFGGMVYLAAGVPAAGRCDDDEYRRAASSETADPTPNDMPISGALEVVEVRSTQIELGRDPGPARTAIALRTDLLAAAQQSPSTVRLRVQSFRRGGNADVRQAVLAWADFSSPQTVVLYLCVERQSQTTDASRRFTLDPGVYTGAATITDPRLPVATIPFTVTLAYPNQYHPLLPLIGIVLVGTLYLMVLRRSPEQRDSTVGLPDLDLFLRKPSGLAAVFVGTTAAVTVYMTTYISNDAWGTGNDAFLLAGSMFGTFIATGTTFRFASNLETSGATPASPNETHHQGRTERGTAGGQAPDVPP